MMMTKDDADSLARAWQEGRVAPEDFDPRITKWRSEETIREAIRTGDISIKQFSEEIERRSEGAGVFGIQPDRFIDKYENPFSRSTQEERQRELDNHADEDAEPISDDTLELWDRALESFLKEAEYEDQSPGTE